jgi:hypothetical protein
VLTDEEWVALLVDGGRRARPPMVGSRCDASLYGCDHRADRVLLGPRMVLCAAHVNELESRADVLGLRVHPSARLAAVTFETADRPFG